MYIQTGVAITEKNCGVPDKNNGLLDYGVGQDDKSAYHWIMNIKLKHYLHIRP